MLMYRVGVTFRESRARLSYKQGVVCIQISEGVRGDKDYAIRSVTTYIKGDDDSILNEKIDLIVIRLKQLYCLIEVMKRRDPDCTIDDISSKYKDLLTGIYNDDIISKAVEKAKSDFVWDRSFVALSTMFIKYMNTNGDNNVKLHRRRRKNKEESQIREVAVTDLTTFTRHLIAQSKSEGKQTRAGNYMACLRYLEDFAKNKPIPFESLDRNFITEFGYFLKSSPSLKESTQSLYMRCFRTILGYAQDEGLLSIGADWFKDTNRKIIFEKDETMTYEEAHGLLMRIVYAYLGKEPELEEMRDIFMFAFYCRGMERNDVMSLTTDNIQNGCLVYKRRGIGRECRIILENRALDIIEKYRQKMPEGDNRLFPIAIEMAYYQRSSVLSIVRTRMNALGERVGYPGLVFNFNINLWRILITQASISSALLS